MLEIDRAEFDRHKYDYLHFEGFYSDNNFHFREGCTCQACSYHSASRKAQFLREIDDDDELLKFVLRMSELELI